MPDRQCQPYLRDLAIYFAVVCPFTLGTLQGVAADNPLWLIVGLVPSLVWGRWEKWRRRGLRRDQL